MARDEFRRQLDADTALLTDVQRAARFVFLQRARFAGRPTSRSFPTSPTQPKALGHAQMRRRFLALSARLARVTIESLPYAEFIGRYDRPSTLFYVDPPYWACEEDYGKGVFSRDDFASLASLLGRIKGRFVMSINDRPEIREAFSYFSVETVQTKYWRGSGRHKPVAELIITG